MASWRALHASPLEPEGRLGLRFVFVDRILHLDPGVSIEIVKNVSASEDVFDDHFPGVPILPGALLVETFEQATQLLVAVTHDFTRVARLERVARAAFRALVRPGDQLTVTCRRRAGDADAQRTRWTVAATAAVTGRTVATATLEVAIVADHEGVGARLRDLHRTLTMDALLLPGMDRR